MADHRGMQHRPIDPTDLRRALGTFATGVTVVTTIDEAGEPRGFTANSFTSVSLDPPLVSVCLAKQAASCRVFSSGLHFAVNVLAEDQQDISALFATATRTRFADLDWSARVTGSPVLAGVLSWFDCAMHNVVDAGDHVILIGRVVDFRHTTSSPLIYCGGAYVAFSLIQKAMEAAQEDTSVRISAIVEHDGSLLFERRRNNARLALPAASRIGSADDKESLLGLLADGGVRAVMSFLFAVYEDEDEQRQNIVYRGRAERVDERADARFTFIPIDQIPWDDIGDAPLRFMLERYTDESGQNVFGVYVGDARSGEVRRVGR